MKEWFGLTPKFVNTFEYDTSKEFQTKYLKAQQANKVTQQEGVSQRKTEEKAKKPEEKEGKAGSTETDVAAKDNNMVKIGALVSVAVLLVLIRFLVF